MSDPWQEFAERAGRAENAGYFERSGGRGRGTGLALSFTRAETVRTVGARTSFDEVVRASDEFLTRPGRRAVLGYLGFDAVGLIEPALATFPPGSPFPLGEFAFVSDPIVRRAPTRPLGPSLAPDHLAPTEDTMPKSRFVASVRRLQHAIREGEAFQAVLAHRRTWPRPADLLERAGRLRRSERFAYFYYLKFGDREIVGATPESVCEVRDGRAFVNPIAGTFWIDPAGPRRPALEVDPKELAEHRMLVDLARNDLGQFARPGTVRLLWRERRVRYARLDHLVSRVSADLPPGESSWSVLRATFPAGTVSGAPKIRATQLLREEEGTWRGPYAGTVGLLDGSDRADWALAIRTGFASGPRFYTAAGAGIVHRSVPSQEFRETLAKLSQLEATLVGGPS